MDVAPAFLSQIRYYGGQTGFGEYLRVINQNVSVKAAQYR